MREPTNPAAVIFDLDGTLLNTEPLYTQATDLLLAPHGYSVTPALKRQLVGRAARVSAGILIDTLNLPFSVDHYLEVREAELRRLFTRVEEIPGASDYVAYLATRGIPMGIATSSSSDLVGLKLADKPWRELISVVVCGDDPRLQNPKPAPDIFLLCCADLGAAPEQCIAFEDSPSGLAAAQAAGMYVIAVENPYLHPEDTVGTGGSIRSFRELLPAA